MKLSEFNSLPEEAARHRLLECCAAPRWADAVLADRPYRSVEQFRAAADELLTEADALAALAGHPRIGERGDRLDGRSRSEQGGVLGAPADVLAALARGNTEYEKRFGHVYLVCATGRGAEELLAVLLARLDHTAETERAVVRDELAAINRLRLDQLVETEVAP